jgi:hypothetical protein
LLLAISTDKKNAISSLCVTVQAGSTQFGSV